MSKWPVKSDSAPSVDQIAKAIVACAEFTGERDKLRERAATSQANLDGVRARWPAIVALNVLWPKCHLDALGKVVGAKSGVANVLSAKRTAWWPTAREIEQVIAAI